MKKKSFVTLFTVLTVCVFLVVGLLFLVLKNNFNSPEGNLQTAQTNQTASKTQNLKPNVEPLDPKKFDTEIASAQLSKSKLGFSRALFNDDNTINAIAYQDLIGIQKQTLGIEKLNVIESKPLQLLDLGDINDNFLREKEENLSVVKDGYLVKKNSARNFEIYNIEEEKLISTIPSGIKTTDQSDSESNNLQTYRELLSSYDFNFKTNLAAIQVDNQIKIYDLKSAKLRSTLEITKLEPSRFLDKLIADKNEEGFAFMFAYIGGFDVRMSISPKGDKLAVMRQELDLGALGGTDSIFKTTTVVDIYDLNTGNVDNIFTKTTSNEQPSDDNDKATMGIIEFSQDSESVFFTLPQRDVAMYNFASKTLKEFDNQQILITAIAVDKNSNILAAGNANGFINIWDINQNKSVSSFKAHNGYIAKLDFADDSTSLLSLGDYDHKLSLWGHKQIQDATNELITPLFNLSTTDVQMDGLATDDFVISKDGRYLYTINYEQEVQKWDLETRKKIWSQKNYKNDVIALSNDGSRLLILGLGDQITANKITSLNTLSGQIILTKDLCKQTSRDYVIAMNPNENTFVINCEIALVVYDVNTLEQTDAEVVATGERNTLGFSPDGKYFISDIEGNYFDDGEDNFNDINIMEIYDSDFKLIKEIKQGDYNPKGDFDATFLVASSISFSPNNNLIAAYSQTARESISLFDYTTYQKVANFILPYSTYIKSVAFHPNNILLAIGDTNGRINIWNIRLESIVQTLSYPGEIKKVLFSPDGSKLVVAGESGLVKVFEVRAGN